MSSGAMPARPAASAIISSASALGNPNQVDTYNGNPPAAALRDERVGLQWIRSAFVPARVKAPAHEETLRRRNVRFAKADPKLAI